MATLLLASAGAALGASLGGPVAGAALGRAAGALVGAALDQRLLGGGAQAVETGRVSRFRVQGAQEGAPVARLYGRMRLPCQVIWSSRFREEITESGGGKGGPPRTRSHSYSVSLALALCAGPIDRIGRIWADGALVDPTTLDLRLHRGTEDQAPDPLIAAIQGADATPAYRGVAYIVLSDLDLGRFGNRIPQFSIEAFRTPARDGDGLREMVEAVALSPGSGEFALDTRPVRRIVGPGRAQNENVNSLSGRPDAVAALDALQEEAPACGAASLVVSWFGDDLRCGSCTIRPKVEEADKTTQPAAWSVSGLSRAQAPVIGQRDGRPVYGGAPDDASVANVIAEMRDRGLAVMFYPFILMDVAPGNGLPNPYGPGDQPVYPWRGRITLDVAPGRPGSVDRTPAVAEQVAAFFGAAQPEHFRREGARVIYDGPEDWGLRRFILHYAHLCAAAGGVDSFCIGSELRGLTWIRSGPGQYPAVAALRALAQDVRAILGPAVKIGYAADWSEYFGHHPDDGTGDAVFHLDPLWADPAIDFIGIDNYMPLSDWRDGDEHADAAAGSPYAPAYLRSQIEGGEGFDWYYASPADRAAQRRTPITDGAHGEPWVFRYKDIRSWWSNPHHDRVGGVRAAQPTGWAPQSKPVWFTEIGCPAVDKGANQPNVFVDPKSSESALPHFSTGARDEQMQRSFLEAALGYWREPDINPVSPLYGGRMIETARSFVWTWDLRPWPDFPRRLNVWSDGDNHRLGHWITGRLGAAPLADLVAEICAEAGIEDPDVSRLRGVVDGYVQETVQSARQALQPLMLAYGFDVADNGGRLVFRPRQDGPVRAIDPAALAVREGGAPVSLTRESDRAAPAVLRFGYLAGDSAYEPATVSAERPAADGAATVEQTEAPLAMAGETARATVERWRVESDTPAETARFALGPADAALEPGDVVSLPDSPAPFVIERIEDGADRQAQARRVARPSASGAALPAPGPALAATPRPALLEAVALEIAEPTDAPALLVAAQTTPWPGPVVVRRLSEDGEATAVATLDAPATLGVLTAPAPGAAAHRWSRAPLHVRLHRGALRSRTELAVLGGANLAAIESAPDRWELIQFREAVLTGPDAYTLRHVLRGQRDGAAPATPAGARFVLLDDAVGRIPLDLDDLGRPITLSLAPAVAAADTLDAAVLTLTPMGRALRPLAPTALRLDTADGARTLRWRRRSRRGGDGWDAHEPPLAEEREAYRVRIAKDGVTLRMAETTSPSFTYPAAQAFADGAVAPFAMHVAQISAAVGPGDEARIDIHD